MAKAMRDTAAFRRALLRQYELMPKLMKADIQGDEAMEVLGAVLARDSLSHQDQYGRRLLTLDRAFAHVLAGCREEWTECLLSWSRDCGFAVSPWWLSVLTTARQLAGQTTTTADLFSPLADVWVTVRDDGGKLVGGLVLKMDKLIDGVVSGVRDVARGVAGDDWETAITPQVQFPSSVHVGFSLPRRSVDGRPDQLDERDEQAARLCIESMAILGRDGREANVEDLIPWDETQASLRKSFDKIRTSLAPSARLEMRASAGITRTTASIVNMRPYSRREPKREVQLRGEVRAVDLDARRVKLRNDTDESKTTLRYGDDTLFPGRLEPREWLGQHVTVRAFTVSRTDPAPFAELLEIDPI
jgi:hypothetical protein